MTYFKSEIGKREILDLYNQKLHELEIEYSTQVVETSFGSTHVIVTGNERNPPMIVVHGSNACAPIALETYPMLSTHFRVYTVDVLAQPNKSAQNRMSMKDHSYGRWMNEVMDQLHLQNVRMAGFSFGGLVILKTLEFDESRVEHVYLSAPAYVVNGNPLKALFNIFIPMKRYMKTQKQKYVEKFLSEVFTARDPFAIQYLSKVFLHFEMDFTPVPIIRTKAAKEIETPITLFAAKKDIMFPGMKMMKRAKRIFPSLQQATLLVDSKHVQDENDNRRIQEVILEDLKGK